MATPFFAVPGGVGSCFSGVFQRLEHFMLDDAEYTKVAMVGADLTLCIDGRIDHHMFTGYGLRVQCLEPLYLLRTDMTKIIPVGPNRMFNPRIVEFCAGTGGIGLGCTQLQGEVVLSVDNNELACAQLRLLGREVLCGDLCDDQVKAAVHASIGMESVTLTAGFPCPPHSTQGLGRGHDDPRHEVFVETLRAAYLMQTHSLVLECTPQAQYDTDVKAKIFELAHAMSWQVKDTTLALSQQWPTRRHRWWAFLCPGEWHSASFPKWPISNRWQQISDILPYWGCWSLEDEGNLKLTPHELAAYHNVAFGKDKRELELSDRCPTILHSYGIALGPCPCGCRSSGFSLSSLMHKGLRGCYVLSEVDQAPRFLHPQELAALLGFPGDLDFVDPPRSAICLLGLVASPLQALWTFSALRSAWLGHSEDETLRVALASLCTYQEHLVASYAAKWKTLPPLPHPLTVHRDHGEPVLVTVWGHSTVAGLIEAEQAFHESDDLLGLFHGDLPLAADQRLAPLRFGDSCTLRLVVASVTPLSSESLVLSLDFGFSFHICIATSGDFLFQLLPQCQVQSWDIVSIHTDHGISLRLDSRIWTSMKLLVELRPEAAALQAWGEHTQLATDGLSAALIASVSLDLCCFRFGNVDTKPVVSDPAALYGLWMHGWTWAESHAFRQQFSQSNGTLYLIVPLDGHWIFLWGFHKDHQLSWICYDGLLHFRASQVSAFVAQLMHILDQPFAGVDFARLIPQQHPHTCGTVALMHLALILGLRSGFQDTEELELHDLLLQLPQRCSLHASGPAELQQQLSTLLVSKGVPSTDSLTRAQEALQALGTASVQEALASRNPWAMLKSLASRPSSRMRLVKDFELRQHIDEQTKEKGGHVKNHKAKKATKNQPKSQPIIDPASLRIIASTFVDDEGDELIQIPFSEVGKDAHGLAFCSLREAQPYVEAGCNISSTTLGLLIPTEVSTDLWQSANIQTIRFPALCQATAEPLLIQGTLVTLSDGAIHRNEMKIPEFAIQDTEVVKLQLYKDEVELDWAVITAGPIRQLFFS